MNSDWKSDPIKDAAIARRQEQLSPSAAILGGFNSEPFYSDEEVAELAAQFELAEQIDRGYFVLEPTDAPDTWPLDRPEPVVTAGDADWFRLTDSAEATL